MNPLHIARNLRDDYLLLLRTTFTPRQRELGEAFLREVERDGFLTREPFVSLAQPYKYAAPLTVLTEETQRRFGDIAERPYAHQAAACQRILDGRPTVVATGTGSGKTEAFLLPILDHCLRHKGEPGPKAILMYPMNALANDQLRRIRERLAGSGVSFGRYTGETQLHGDRPGDAPEEERCTRTEFRANPPDIVLTNYQMLEYMLIRGDGRDIFANHRVRFIVLDEVHTYHGALGTDVACLMRRLRSALAGTRPDDPPPLFIGTSATLHAGLEGGDPRDGIAAFFTRLTGQETTAEAVIMEEPDIPRQPEGLAWPPAPEIPRALLDGFDPDDTERVLTLARLLAGVPPNTRSSLEDLWSRTPLPYVLTAWLGEPLSLGEIVERLSKEPGRERVSSDQLAREVEAGLLVGPCLPDEHPLRLRPRVHRFLRGLVPFWRCTNPDCGKLLNEGVAECDECASQALPLALCRTCGWDFLMGRCSIGTLAGEGISSWPPRRPSTKDTVYLHDVPTAPPEIGDEEDVEELESPEPEQAPDDDGAEAGAVAGEDEGDHGRQYLCPSCLTLTSSPGDRPCGCPDDKPMRPVLVYRHRGTKCPVCGDTYGAQDILTPVGLGNSSALSHVSRTLIRDLPADRRKLLVFCDSRQDAAHQARFIASVEGHVRLRRGVCSLLSADHEMHDFRWLIDALYHDRVERGFLPRARTRDAQERDKAKIEGELVMEFAIFTKARAGLERLGLVRVRYAQLEEELQSNEFEDLCAKQGIGVALALRAVPALLDYMRTRRALAHEALQFRLRTGDRLSDRYGLQPGPIIGFPVAFRWPGQKSEKTHTYALAPAWGGRSSVQRLWRQLVGEDAADHSIKAVLEWLADRGYLQEVRIGKDGDEASGWQVSLDNVLFEAARTYAKCNVCGRVAANEPTGGHCFRVGCEGTLDEWVGPLQNGNLEALIIGSEYAPALVPAEHSAAITDDRREEIEKGFTSAPPRYNILACTPTLELGVNIGELEAVAMRNIPPNPAHYAQRAGRTGRQTRMGVVAGFARNTPHDGYFFDHPDEVISGSIPPPRFNMQNLEAVARHVHSLAIEEARIEFPSDLQPFISNTGVVNESRLKEAIAQVAVASPAVRRRSLAMFADVIRDEQWLDEVLDAFPRELEAALRRRAALIAEAISKKTEIGIKAVRSHAERRAEDAYEELAKRMRQDYRYAYLPRVLAEEGLLPGYAFPGDPGSLSLGFDPEPVFAGRLQAQREYAPGQVVYLRGQRWRVQGVALHRPGATRTSGRSEFEFTECPSCGLANQARGRNTCLRCRAELSGPSMLAWDAGAFQADAKEMEPQAEEERLIGGFDVRPHPQRDAVGTGFAIGPWRLSLRRQETIWWINHGRANDDADGATGGGFPLCRTCGRIVSPVGGAGSQQPTGGSKRRRADPAARRDQHLERCGGQPELLCLGHEFKADTLRLFVPGLAGLGSEGVDWAVSLAHAILQGAIRVFDLDDDDLEPLVLVARDNGKEQAMEILWTDTVLGGSGILEGLAAHFPAVAAAAAEHLAGHDCPKSCYRCLRTYRNQRQHGRLNWRLVVRYLEAAAQESVIRAESDVDSPLPAEGLEWDEARREGCESPLELRLLRAIRGLGLPEPDKQSEIQNARGAMLTRADFAYPDKRLLVYVDSLAFHTALSQRLHDSRQTNELQTMGYRVLRFLGPEVHRDAAGCARQVEAALGAT